MKHPEVVNSQTPKLTFNNQGITVSPGFRVLLLVLSVIFLSLQINYAQSKPSAHIVWNRQPGATTYRIQIATDEQFTDVLIDSLINGTEYFVRDLPVGKYFWRVASIGTEKVVFQKPVAFEVTLPRAVPSPTPFKAVPVRTPVASKTPDTTVRTRHALPGWSVATGEIVRLFSAQLRRGAPRDFLSVNSQGKVYALDGARGIALWTAAFNLGAAGDERVRTLYNNFAPLVLDSKSGPRVVVAFDRGLRALDGATGREVWSTRMAGRPVGATVIGSDIYLVGEKADRLVVFDSLTGQLKSQIELRDEAVGPPVLLTNPNEAQLLVPLKDGLIELVTVEGKYLRSFKLATEVTTLPRLVSSPSRSIVLIGLKNGLVAFDAATVEPLGRIAIEAGDYPVGELSIFDLDGDSFPEAVMTTNGGRVISVDVAAGKVNWSISADVGSTTPAFADLDADAKLDVVLPGSKNFAIGVSGINGSLIWDSGEEGMFAANKPSARTLAIATVQDGRLMLVGTDRSAAGLRAFEVQRSSSRSTP
jgi:outer membrane protein assembly factor BamB